MLTLHNVSVVIQGNTILDNVSCTIKSGDFITIVGPNGAGKSTLFNVIAGRLLPTSGTITLDGIDITHLDERSRAPYISRLFQDPRLNGVLDMTVKENIAMAGYKGQRARFVQGTHDLHHDTLLELLAPFNLDDRAIIDAVLGSLSGGQRQAVAFIMATMIPPRLLMLDEPTAALDPLSATTLLKIAVRYIRAHKLSTLLITHDPELAAIVGDEVWVIEQGKIARQFESGMVQAISAYELVGSVDYKAIQYAALGKKN